jgi:hypothetical protein
LTAAFTLSTFIMQGGAGGAVRLGIYDINGTLLAASGNLGVAVGLVSATLASVTIPTTGCYIAISSTSNGLAVANRADGWNGSGQALGWEAPNLNMPASVTPASLKTQIRPYIHMTW